MTNSRILFILESHILLTSSFSDNIYVTYITTLLFIVIVVNVTKKCTSLKSQKYALPIMCYLIFIITFPGSTDLTSSIVNVLSPKFVIITGVTILGALSFR